MLEPLIEAIQSGQEALVLEVGGKTFCETPMVQVRPVVPRPPDCLNTMTLRSVVDFLRANIDGLDLKKLMVHVKSISEVLLLPPLNKFSEDEGGIRSPLLVASCSDPVEQNLGRFMRPEEAVVAWLGWFVGDDELSELLRMSEKVSTVVDDGVSQQVTTSAGVSRVAAVTMRSTYVLRARRSFPDFVPLESEYLIRVRAPNEGELPTVALFALQDRLWKMETVARIGSELHSMMSEAGVVIPVLA